MVSASLIVAAVLSWLPIVGQKREIIERKDWGIIFIAALLWVLCAKR